ncbi:MAG: protein-L-isoaspartate O-methyltransferase family protein [Acidiferrobacteraceae bacterium]
MNFEAARFNMIRQQIRPYHVLDERVLDAIARAPREDFVPAAYRALAFADMEIPLGRGEVMLAPKLEARLLQELDLSPGDRVLEVGTGSGYFTALLAGLAATVHTVEIHPGFKQDASVRLAAHGVTNVSCEVGDAAHGWPRHAPYDAIVLTGSVPELAQSFRTSLREGGRIVAVIGRAPAMELRRIERLGDDLGWRETSLIETVCPPLRHAEPPAQFVF